MLCTSWKITTEYVCDFFCLTLFGTNIIQLFHACLVNSQNYAPRCGGQLNALLPKAPRGVVFTILPNRHEITVLLPNQI